MASCGCQPCPALHWLRGLSSWDIAADRSAVPICLAQQGMVVAGGAEVDLASKFVQPGGGR